MRDGCYIRHRLNANAGALQGAHRALAARAGAFHIHIRLLQAVFHGQPVGVLRCDAGRKRRALRLPRKPAAPAVAQQMVPPVLSVTVMIVLLKLALMCTCPNATFLRAARVCLPAWRAS